MQATLDPTIVAEARRLQIRTRRSADSDLVGLYRSSFRGQGLQFSELREYQPGDDVRRIDWKVAARSSRIYVKSFEEDHALRVLCAVDISHSTAVGYGPSAFQRAARIAALISLLAARSHDALGLMLFAEKVHQYLSPAQQRRQLLRILLALSQPPSPPRSTDVGAALLELARRERRRSVVFLFSDFHSRPFEEPLRLLARRHDVIGLWLAPAQVSTLPAVGLVQVEDAETGALRTIDTSSPAIRALLAEREVRRRETLSKIFCSAGAELCEVREDCVSPLKQLMERRVRRR